MKPNNILYTKCTEDSFYRFWIEFLAPYHRLTSRERDVAARVLAQYFKLKDSVPDPEVMRDILWSRKSKKDMMASLGMSQAHFQMVLGKLRAAGILIDYWDINPKYIPHKTENPKFVLQIMFDWSSPNNPIKDEEKPAL